MKHANPSLIAQRLMAHVEGTRAERERLRDRSRVVERLPFTIRLVRHHADLLKAVEVRRAAYARHLPEFAQTLDLPEEADFAEGAVVLLAESKLDGSPLGSVRIQTNDHQALALEESVELPLWLQSQRMAEVSRLGVEEGRIGHLVKIALVKACFDYCEQSDVQWAVVTARKPVDRHYEQLMFTDVFADKRALPLRHVHNIPHRIMAFNIATGEERWEAAKHPLLTFFRHTRHPDIPIAATPMLRLTQGGGRSVRRQAVGPTFGLVAA